MKIPEDWTFTDHDVAKEFDHHVREQLPWYDLATGMVAHVARHYIPHGGRVYDVGASTGNIGRALAKTLSSRDASLVAVESEPEMAERYDGPGELVVADARDVKYEWCDVIIAFLLFMFIPVSERESLLDKFKLAVKRGGAIIIVDKQDVPEGYVGTVMRRLTLAGKVATGVPSDEIVAKELSLAGVQRPVSKSWPHGGVEIFRFGEFAGWLIEA